MQAVASQNAPSPNVVVPHFIVGGAFWLAIISLIIVFPESLTQHFFNPKLLAITHLLALGWISMVIFGALYQLVPVILEEKLFSEKLGYLSFLFLTVGAVTLAIAFWKFEFGPLLLLGGSIVLLSIFSFASNIFMTSFRSAKHGIERIFILTSITWLLITVIVGFILAINLTRPFLSIPHTELLKVHANIGIIGWFIQLIIGVGSRLLPMFMVAHGLSTFILKIAYTLINSGMILGIISYFFHFQTGLWLSIFLVLGGLILFLSFLHNAYRVRIKKELDTGMKKSFYSFVVLIIPMLMILVIKLFDNELSVQVITAFGISILIGFISSLIMGQTYKTLPFIIWLNVYRSRIGKGKIPFPRELYSDRIAQIQLWSFVFGFPILLLAVFFRSNQLITLGGGMIWGSTLLYNINLWKIVLHKPNLKHENKS